MGIDWSSFFGGAAVGLNGVLEKEQELKYKERATALEEDRAAKRYLRGLSATMPDDWDEAKRKAALKKYEGQDYSSLEAYHNQVISGKYEWSDNGSLSKKWGDGEAVQFHMKAANEEGVVPQEQLGQLSSSQQSAYYKMLANKDLSLAKISQTGQGTTPGGLTRSAVATLESQVGKNNLGLYTSPTTLSTIQKSINTSVKDTGSMDYEDIFVRSMTNSGFFTNKDAVAAKVASKLYEHRAVLQGVDVSNKQEVTSALQRFSTDYFRQGDTESELQKKYLQTVALSPGAQGFMGLFSTLSAFETHIQRQQNPFMAMTRGNK